MSSDLHARLLAATDPGASPPWAWRVLRVVVELHAPVEDSYAASRWLDCRGCDSRGEAADWPCTTVRAIARGLGIETAP